MGAVKAALALILADALSPPLSLEAAADDGELEPLEAAVFCASGVTMDWLAAGDDAPVGELSTVLLRPILRPPSLLEAGAIVVAGAIVSPPVLEPDVRNAERSFTRLSEPVVLEVVVFTSALISTSILRLISLG